MANSNSRILSLPFDIVEDIMELIITSIDDPIWQRPLLRPSATSPFKFSHFCYVRERNKKSPYAIRRVCRYFNNSITRFLFREVYVRPRWHWLGINPPLRDLVSPILMTPSGRCPGQVFTEHARILRLDLSFLEEWASLNSDDDYLEDIPDIESSPEMLNGYPGPLTMFQRERMFEALKVEVKEMLPQVVSSFLKISEIRYDIYSDFGSSWLRLAHAKALSASCNVRTLVLTTPINSKTWGTAIWSSINSSLRRPIFEGLSAVISHQLPLLQTIDFSFHEKSFPDDLDELWRSWTLTPSNNTTQGISSSICLRSLTINAAAISMVLLRFLASFRGLDTLVFTPLGGAGRNIGNTPTDYRDLSSFYFHKVLKSHHETLTRLQMPCFDATTDLMGRWAIGPTNIEHLVQCTRIRSLTTSFHLLSTSGPEDVKQKLESLLDLVRSLPLLTDLRLICTGFESRPGDFLLHIHQAFKTMPISHASQEKPAAPTCIGIVGTHWHSSANVLQYELTQGNATESETDEDNLQWQYCTDDMRVRSYR
ncbi:hypothetical protein CPB83DRAFT_845771 [Crepidotus variabilis]|uniref:Uncharacterized protein n=1 Tax=Crepidotus variabilis TaxID=179855 RepID=A0A9P6JUL0_9AGAR|nr:hypothetical protein CPB83DRAFT_845771 [Crepidotus variabilis]